MGQVYRATDTKLKRQVAIKILPPSLATDHDRLARFQREAEVLASLNHPNIAIIHGLEDGDGVKALVMELVEGDDLSQRISRGAIPLDEALPIAKQIADALEAAHEQGIIHRDLKPANIKVRSDGTVKVLDFGLAKTASADTTSPVTQSPTTFGPTAAGTLLGTAPYMSPEQVRGTPADKRADIWAFGCVLYEMLTGRRAFGGDTSSDASAAILERQPEWKALPDNTPPAIRRLLRRCLEKDRRQRQRDIGDARLEINDVLAGADLAPPSSRAGRAARVIAPIAIGAFLIGAGAAWSLRRPPDSAASTAPVRRLTVRIQSGVVGIDAGLLGALRGGRGLAVSPDGTRVVLVASSEGPFRLYVRALNQAGGQLIDGTEGASAPFWSPDGRWIAYFASGKLRKIPAEGGRPTTVCDVVDDTGGASGAWGPDATIVYALPTSARAGLMRVPAGGGTPEVFTTPDPDVGGGHGDPSFTVDGRAVLFVTRQTRDGVAPSIMLRSLATPEQRKLVEGTDRPLHIASGYLMFGRGPAVFAARFDSAAWRVLGTSVPVQDAVVRGQVDLSADGLLTYIAEPSVDGRALVWVDRAGAAIPLLQEHRGFARPRLSPDEKRLTVEVAQDTGDPALRTLGALGSGSDVWVYSFQNGAFTRLTSTGRSNSPFWTPAGARIAFRTGATIFWQAADGLGPAEPLIAPTDQGLKAGSSVAPGVWSPDGRTLLFVVHTSGPNGADIWALKPGPPRSLRPLIERPGDQWSVRVSPDGRWMSYASNESGRFEIYVEPFGGGARHPVSTDGGEQAIWSPKGDELFYRAGDRMMAVTVPARGSSFEAARPHELFRGRYASSDLAAYDVSRDATRFLMVRPSEDELRPAEISIVENWTGELKRLVPPR